ncbi:MAG: gliding motility-associated C-terminal domain-containing protein [Flavobacteriaceae bacterium]|nr:gliding motility-associated C-terminal domain-containing protein [Flavobacteriaceae bacterium]
MKKKTFLTLAVILLYIATINSQCVVINASQSFGGAGKPTIAELTLKATLGTPVWYVSETSINALSSTTLLVDNVIYYAGSSGSCSDPRIAVTVDIPLPPKVDAIQGFCITDPDIIVGELSSIGNDVKWYSDDTPTALLLVETDVLEDYGVYYASQVDIVTDWESARVPLIVHIISNELDFESIQYFCEDQGKTVSDLDIGTEDVRNYISELDNDTPKIKWYANREASVVLPNNEELEDGKSYYAKVTTIPCENTDIHEIKVVLVTIPLPTVPPFDQKFCSIYQPKVSNLEASLSTVVIPDVDSSKNELLWYIKDDYSAPLNADTLLASGSYSVKEYNPSLDCYSLPVDVEVVIVTTVDATFTGTDTGPFDFCSTEDARVEDLNSLLNYEDPVNYIKWYSHPTADGVLDVVGNTSILEDDTIYYAQVFSDLLDCPSEKRTAVEVNIETIENATITTPPQFCSLNGEIISDLNSLLTYGDTYIIEWYDEVASGNKYDNNTIIIDGATYYAEVVNSVSGCTSEGRLAISISTDNIPDATLLNSPIFCSIESSNISSLNNFLDYDNTKHTIIWYNSLASGSQYPSDQLLTDEKTYYGEVVNPITGCTSTNRIVINVIEENREDPVFVENPNFCIVDKNKVDDLDISLNYKNNTYIIEWYDNLEGGAKYDKNDLLINSQIYYGEAVNKVTGCISDNRIAVVSVLNDSNPPSGDSLQVFCLSEKVTINDLKVEGESVLWYLNESDISPITDLSILLENDKKYYSRQSDMNGCPSSVAFVVKVSLIDITEISINEVPVFCKDSNPIVRDLSEYAVLPENLSAIWYTSQTGGVKLDLNTALENNTTYYLSAYDGDLSCEGFSRESVEVKVQTLILPELRDENLKFCELEKPTISSLEATFDLEEYISFKWYKDLEKTNKIENTYVLEDKATYYAYIENDYSYCKSIDMLVVTVDLRNCDPQDYSFFIPGGFSPNNDGINDNLGIDKIKYIFPNYKLEVFNRYGLNVFTGNADSIWNGKYKGEELPMGTYFYVLHFNKGSYKAKQGIIHLRR